MANLELCDLPSDISAVYLPYTPTLRQRQKAYAFSRNSYVHNVKILRDNDVHAVNISAKVYRSQRKSETPHGVNMTVNTCTKTITDGYCSCKSGISGECSHLLATLMTLSNWILEGYKQLPTEQSCTSLPQNWDKPRGPKILPEPVSQMVICNPGNISRKRKPLMAAFHDNRMNKETDVHDLNYLQNLSGCPIAYLAQPCPKTIKTTYGSQYIGSGLSYHAPLMNPVKPPNENDNYCGNITFPILKDIELPSVVTENSDKWTELEMDIDSSIRLEKETRSQSDSQVWKNERKKRVTASNFGKIIKRKANVTTKFLQAMFQSQDFVSKPTTYGKANERVAKQLYIKKTGRHAHEIGLVVNPKVPFLGATPDGKVCDNGATGILEIKCPYSVRDMTLSEACRNDKYGPTFFLRENGSEMSLARTHEYWYQVQGQLLLTGSPFCDFVTFTRKDFHIERITPDMDTFTLILKKLSDFYVNYVHPFLENSEINDIVCK